MSLFEIQDEIRKSVDKDQLEEWLRLEPAKVYLDLLINWSLILAAIAAVAIMPVWWMFLIAFFAIGFNQYALFIIGHDGVHSCVHPNRPVNDLICRWLVFGPMCMGFHDAKRSHLEHHKLMGTEEDPDRYLHTLAGKNSPLSLALYCSGLATFGKTVLKVTPIGPILRAQSAPAAANAEPPTKLLSAYFKERIPVMVMVPLLIAFFFALHLPWWFFLAMWILPIYVCVFVADEIRAMCDHAVAIMPDQSADEYRLVTYVPSIFEKIVFSPHNMNLHAEHHLWPRIPYYKREQAHQAVKSSPRITYHKSYVVFVAKLFSLVPMSGTERVVSPSVADSEAS
ncbi:MAG TPA: fatty acid desaturase [Trichormus sp.]|jgi:fatty acid desaturase